MEVTFNLGVFTLIILILSALVAIGTWYYVKKQEGESPNVNFKMTSKRKAITLKDIFEVQDIQKGIIILPNNNYCAICRLSSPDFYLLGEAEQDHIEDAAAGVLMQLNYPVQFLVTAESLDTRSSVQEIRNNIQSLSPLLQELALARAEYLEILMRDRAVSARQAYIILPFTTIKGFNQAYAELQTRIASITSIFAGAKVKVEVLKDTAIIDLLSHLLNRNRAFRPSEALMEGITAPFHIGRKGVS